MGLEEDSAGEAKVNIIKIDATYYVLAGMLDDRPT